MATDKDEFPYESADPDLKPVPGRQVVSRAAVEVLPPEEVKTLLRLLIGSAIEGNDEFNRRAREWQAEMNQLDPAKRAVSAENETEADRLRYALVGFLFDAIDTGYRGLTLVDKTASRTISTMSVILSPITESRFWRPVKNRFNRYSGRGETVLSSWTETGRREELASRTLVRKQAYEGMINDVIEYLAEKPEVSDLIQQQSVGMAAEIMDDIRERSAEFDTTLEDRVKSILKRPRSK